jgi:hypothetical protein
MRIIASSFFPEAQPRTIVGVERNNQLLLTEYPINKCFIILISIGNEAV